MKICKRLTVILCLATAVLMLLPLPARAAGDIDLNADVGLNLTYQKDGVKLAGASFSLYRVADVAATGELTITKEFSQFNVDIRGKNDEAWRTLASTLEGYVQLSGVPAADSGKTDASGKLSFPTAGKTLRPGLYLVLGKRLTLDGKRYDPTPFVVMLPTINKSSNTWDYFVSASPKSIVSNVPQTVTPGNPANTTNTEDTTITRRVLKMWDDEGVEDQRPKSVTVQLLRDGRVYDTVTLSAENNWHYTWTNLDSRYTWTMTERPVSDEYTVRIWREGVTFVVKNVYGEEIEDEDVPLASDVPLPKTGQLWWPVPLMTMAGLAFLVIGLLRRRGGYGA